MDKEISGKDVPMIMTMLSGFFAFRSYEELCTDLEGNLDKRILLIGRLANVAILSAFLSLGFESVGANWISISITAILVTRSLEVLSNLITYNCTPPDDARARLI